MIGNLLNPECKECINLYDYDEMRCAFCEEHAYYRDALEEE
jgi:hypothetical protein